MASIKVIFKSGQAPAAGTSNAGAAEAVRQDWLDHSDDANYIVEGIKEPEFTSTITFRASDASAIVINS